MNKIVRNVGIISLVMVAIVGILFIIGFNHNDEVAVESSENVILEESLESIESVESQVLESEVIESEPVVEVYNTPQELLEEFNASLTGRGYMTFNEEINGFVMNFTNEETIINIAESITGDKIYWNEQIRDPYIEISSFIEDKLGGKYPLLLKNPGNDTYLMIALNGTIIYDEINGIDSTGELINN